jgi:peptide/nickel transport system permease protein
MEIQRKANNILKMINSDGQLRAGVICLIFILLVALFAPLLAPFDPYYLGPDSVFAPGTTGHLLGTNNLGQDVLSMIIFGVRTSLQVAVISALISGALGIIFGGVAGYFGGLIDQITSEIINIFLMLPTFFLILLVVALFGNSIVNVMIVIGLVTWPSNAKLMRAQALTLRERTFVKSAITMGETKSQILFKYIIPNGVFPVVANTTMGMAYAILTEASLSFLGLGDPTVVSWGQMIFNGKAFITSAWWVSTFAGLAIVLTVLVFYLVGDGLSHVLNPKYKTKGTGAQE